MDEKKKHVAASNGFVWGLLLGGGLMYLISTKNGRRILKELSEGGWERLHEVLDVDQLKELKKTLNDEFSEFDEADFEGVEQEAQKDLDKKPSKRKRIFRGVRGKK